MSANSPTCPHCEAILTQPQSAGTCPSCGKSLQKGGRWGRPELPPSRTNPTKTLIVTDHDPESPKPILVAKRVPTPEPKPASAPRKSAANPQPPHSISPGLVFGILGGLGVLMLVTAVGGYFAYSYVTDRAAAPTTANPVPTESRPATTEPLSVAKLENIDGIKTVKKATVLLKVTDWNNRKSSGTGFFAGEKGYVLTNAHVVGYGPTEVREPQKIEVILNSGEKDQRTLSGTVYGYDADRDLALVRVFSSELPEPLPIKSASALSETDQLVIFGFPFGEALGMNISINTTTVSSLRRENGELTVVQLGGGMHPGNSGGPVASKNGEVLGVCVAGIRGTQINFAIPGDLAETFVREQLESGGTNNLGKLAANTSPTTRPNPIVRPNPRPNPRPFPDPNPNPNPPEPRDVVKLAPVVPVEFTAAPITGDKAEMKLPGTISDVCVGGGGRYLCLHLGKTRQIAVYDLCLGKVAKYFPIGGDNVRIAAGMNKLIAVTPEPGTITRFDFAKMEKETTVPLPFKGVLKTVAMGSASAGPLLVHYGSGTGALDNSPTILLDPATFKEIRPGNGIQMHACYRDHLHFRASPDGTVFGTWCTSHSPSGVTSIIVSSDSVKSYNQHTSGGHVVPGPDGTIFTGMGLMTPELKALGKHNDRSFNIPAVSGNLYLDLAPDGNGAGFPVHQTNGFKATVRMLGDARPIVTLPKFDMALGGENWVAHDFTTDKRFIFVPEAKAIVVIPTTNDRLQIHKFDMEASLEKAGIDFLFATSRPPVAIAGKKFEYSIKVRSKKGGVKLKLDAAPDGMKLADGKLTWDVPADWAEPANVIVTISDASGQEIFHTFSLAPGGEGNKVGGFPVGNPNPNLRINPLPEPVDPGKDVIAPPSATLPIKVTEAKDNTSVNLPGTVDSVCVAGGGRYIVFRIPKSKQLALFDVNTGKVAKYIPIAEDGALFAGGMTKLYILNPTANVLQRWDLAKLEKETTVANPLGGTPKQMLMGHLTDGPIFLAGSGVGGGRFSYGFLDPRTWKQVEIKVQGGRGGGPAGIGEQYPPSVRVSGDGRVYAWWTPGLSPSGLCSMVIGSSEAKGYWEHTSVGEIIPGPDGTLFTGSGPYTPELKKLNEKEVGAAFPATSGPWYFQVKIPDRFSQPRPRPGEPAAKPQLMIKMLGENRPLVTFTELAGFDMELEPWGGLKRGSMSFAERIHLIPEADLIVVLNKEGNKLHLHRFDIKTRLEKLDLDFLFVMSRPPAAAGKGMKFTYTPEVLSKKGGVKVKVEAGPEGMAAAGTTVTWDVPAAAPAEVHDVILTISDASGQETFHTFKLTVR